MKWFLAVLASSMLALPALAAAPAPLKTKAPIAKTAKTTKAPAKGTKGFDDPLLKPINVNSADAKTLTLLPGIGPKKAEKIIAGRPYKTPEDLLKVKGIGPKTLAKFKGKITFGTPGKDPKPGPKSLK